MIFFFILSLYDSPRMIGHAAAVAAALALFLAAATTPMLRPRRVVM
jgi:hypothetical protein